MKCSNNRIIVSRTDRAGDLILTLPVIEALRFFRPDFQIVAHVRKYTAPLLYGFEREIEILIDEEPNNTLKSLKVLSKNFYEVHADAAIIVHPSFQAVFSLFLAGIPLRIGRASNIWQCFLNKPLYQGRSLNEKHEFEYNLDLLKGLGINPPKILPKLKLRKQALEKARNSLSLSGKKNFPSQKYIVIHPGHGGSAYNISPEDYKKTIKNLLDLNHNVVMTIGPGEEKIADHFSDLVKRDNMLILSNIIDLEALAGIISQALAFVSGSTGPLHMAAALNIPTFAFFPPVPAMTPKRWGPVGNLNHVWIPSVEICSGKCSSCKHFPCMTNPPFDLIGNWLKTVF
ncbi:MAG: glycosyltransferase family 9 protein [Candidatus Riflebacteria bacterium]|nr:glycosyltransferase family 9 protein [Candidatus Riflebacteria bacterium]